MGPGSATAASLPPRTTPVPIIVTDSTPGSDDRRPTASRMNRRARSGVYFIRRGRSRISATCDESYAMPPTICPALLFSTAAAATSATETAACAASSRRPDAHRPVSARGVRLWTGSRRAMRHAGTTLNRAAAAIAAAIPDASTPHVKPKS